MKRIKRREEKRREDKRREEKGGKGREGKGRAKARNSGNLIQRLDRQRKREHRMIAPKQKGEKHPSAGVEQERNKRPTTLKMYKGSRTRTICARVKTWYI